MSTKSDTTKSLDRFLWWVLLAAALAVVIFVRIRLRELPLERDEGEYAYTGQLLLQGIPPYKLAYSMKFPGTAAAYGFLMSIFGQTIAGLHLGLLLVNLVTIACVFLLGRRLLNELAAVTAAATYAVLSLMPYVLGLEGHATHFVVLFAVAGALLLIRALNRDSPTLIFLSGLLFGMALLMKQPGVFVAVFGEAYLLKRQWQAGVGLRHFWIRNVIFLCGVILPFAITCGLLWNAGVFAKFWFWTVQYARQYGTAVSIADGFKVLIANVPQVLGAAWGLWVLAAMGIVACALDKEVRARADFLLALTFFSLLALCSGFYFRPHYFILLLPATALLAGAAMTGAVNFLRPYSRSLRLIVLVLFGVALSWPIWAEADFLFERPLVVVGRMVNGTNPFRESVKLAEYLRANTTVGETIAVLGSEPQIYFYCGRHSATGYIYTYGLMEPQPYAHEMQQEMIREIETARPKFLVLVVMNRSWLAGKDSDRSIFKWADQYCDQSYEEVGLVNIFDEGTDYYFEARPEDAKPASDHILIYRRKA